MKLLFVRHGSRERNPSVTDANQPLRAEGRTEIANLAHILDEVGDTPTKCFSSKYKHANEAARLVLYARAAGPLQVVELESLTPNSSLDGISAFLAETRGAIDDGDVALIVGHEPRLGQLVAEMTSTRVPPICRGGVVCVEAPRLADIVVGRGKVTWRWPVGDAGGVDLTPKLTSKMQVSGVLAGLTLTSVAVLFATDPNMLQVISALFLTLGAGLFVASLYIYDRLLMPAAFRPADGGGPSIGGNGLVHYHMVRAWQYVFSPGLAAAVIGYALMFASIGADRRALPPQDAVALVSAYWPLALCVAVIIAVVLVYRKFRPRLGVD
jgi:phosphohistidine phosphatase SixA/phage shock protein PspC (stress-responsive transcriptional regulator)